MNFDEDESARLYHGAKAMGAKPFAAFTHANSPPCALPTRPPSAFTPGAPSAERGRRLMFAHLRG